jgi:hypothetical protein
MRTLRQLLLISITFFTACSTTLELREVTPEPNINLDYGGQTISLRIDKKVRDTFSYHSSPSMVGLEVCDWHKSIRNAFRHSFRRSIPTIGNAPDLVIQLLKADFTLAPAAVTERGQSVAIRGTIKFQANLVDRVGKTIGRAAGTALSKRAFTERAQVDAAAADAIETMFEQVALEFFQD